MMFYSRMTNVTILPTTQSDQNQRVSQMIVKKINTNRRIVVVNSTVSPQLSTANKASPNVATNAANQRGGPR